jgi:TRAP-type mannitol/chloroaromatic compound transport system permease small subunit
MVPLFSSSGMIKILDRTVLPVIDRISWLLAMIAMVQIVLLIVAMLYEVVLRYGFGSPTLWSNDIVKYLNGTLFLLAAGWTLRKNQHVRIDFLAVRLPVRVQHAINLLFYAVLLLPLLWLLSSTSFGKAWKAWRTGELEQASAWEPLVWPFLAGLAIGLAGLALQALAETIRHAIGVADPDAVYAPGTSDEHTSV